MQSLTSLQIMSATIVALLGFLFRIGLFFQNEDNKKPKFINVFFMFIFSLGIAYISLLFVTEKDISETFKLIIICAASFFGTNIVDGLGSIKGEFFAKVFKDMIRKWVNASDNTNDDSANENESV